MPDISDTLAPNSDQLDAVDLLGGPQVFTITKVDVNKGAEQPVTIHLAEFPRPWRPGKSMRRVLAACWGAESDAYVGRRVKLYCDERVKFGNDIVGGTRIEALSGIPKRKSVPLLVSRGKSAMWTVDPLPNLTPREQLAAEWRGATPERRKEIEAEVAALDADKPPAEVDPTADPSWGQGDGPGDVA